MKKACQFVLVAALSLLIASQAAAAVFDLSKDYSITNGNPNGVWTYGSLGGSPETFTLLNSPGGVGEVIQWLLDGHEPVVGKNPTDHTVWPTPAHTVWLHPGNAGDAAVVRWIAPAAGTASIVGEFLAGASGVMDVAIRRNGNEIWHELDAGAFGFDENVVVGDIFDFTVYTGPNNYWSGTTPLDLAITLIPEPSTLGLLALGALPFLRRRAS